jgi:lysophospholipase L1-like esterase
MKYIFSFLAILFLFSVSAQQKTSLYTIGDSTMANKPDPDENPEKGWAQMLPEFLDAELEVKNHSVNGRSTKSFIDEGRWKAVYDQLQKGDYVFIQFGHNDQKIKDSTRYTNPYTQYRYNLELFVKETRAKGAIPVLFSSIVRRNFNEQGVLVDTHGDYPLVVRMVAKDLEVPFVDLQALTEKLEIEYGPEKSKSLHLHFEPGENLYEPNGRHDDTHLSEKGASIIAILALKDIEQKGLELKKHIKPEVLEQIRQSTK